MMSEYTPNIAPLNDGSSAAAPAETTTQDAPEPAPITEQEVGEYREQDRFLPVSTTTLPSPSSLTRSSEDCECGEDHEIQRPYDGQNL